MWIFRKVQNPTFTFFRRHVLQVLAKMLFLAKQAGMDSGRLGALAAQTQVHIPTCRAIFSV
jgi:hypothetical protein